MITLHVSGHNFEVDEKILDYVNDKIGGLDKYLPRSQKGTQGRVILTMDPSGRQDNQYHCEAELQVAGPNLQAKEATINMYAAVDIVVAKLKSQAIRYKQKHSPKQRRGQIFVSKLLGRAAPPSQPEAEEA